LLAEVLELYYTHDELMEMAAIFDVTFSDSTVWKSGNFSWLGAARQFVERIDRGNHYQMLESILGALEQRNKTATASSRQASGCGLDLAGDIDRQHHSAIPLQISATALPSCRR